MTHSQWITATQKPMATLNEIVANFNDSSSSYKSLIAAELETIPTGWTATDLIEDAEAAFIDLHQIGVQMGIKSDTGRLPIDNARHFIKSLTLNNSKK